jgi:signal transduction histidine kinase
MEKKRVNTPPTGASSPSLLLLRNTRLLLTAGFGGLLLLMSFSGVDAVRVLRSIQSRNDRIRADFLDRNRLLNQIRSDLYLSGTYVRDYLLEPESANADIHRASLDKDRSDMEAALKAYALRLTPREVAPYGVLTRELQDYWRVLEPVMRWDAEQRKARSYAFLRDEVFPRRMAMLTIADQIARVSEQQLNDGNAQVASLFSQFRSRLSGTVIATFGLGLLLAALSMTKILRLERESDNRYLEIEEARRELKELSARLVQAQENERTAISRELHDEVGQSLSALLVGLSNLSAAIPPAVSAELKPHVDGIRELAQNSVRVVRNMALLLRPSMLDDLGLIPALEWQARELSRSTGIRVNVAAEGVPDNLSEQHKTCIYRIVQEALHNCARHSGASMARITVKHGPEAIHVMVQDDGCGFKPENGRGLGLLGMQERVTNLGGTFQIDSHLGRGTLLAIALPLEEQRAAVPSVHP